MPDRQVISTRLMAASFIEEAANKGIAIRHVPFIDIIPLTDPATVEAIKIASTAPLTAIFTSEQAVEAVAKQLVIQPHWQAACISGQTAEAVKRNWPQVPVLYSGKDSGTLAAALVANPPEGKILFFCGNQRMSTLPESLHQANIAFEELTVYRTEPMPRKIQGAYDGIIFFSPSAARSFFSSNIPGPHTDLFTIGQTTAACVKEYTNLEVHCSEEPSQAAITRLLINYYATK